MGLGTHREHWRQSAAPSEALCPHPSPQAKRPHVASLSDLGPDEQDTSRIQSTSTGLGVSTGLWRCRRSDVLPPLSSVLLVSLLHPHTSSPASSSPTVIFHHFSILPPPPSAATLSSASPSPPPSTSAPLPDLLLLPPQPRFLLPPLLLHAVLHLLCHLPFLLLVLSLSHLRSCLHPPASSFPPGAICFLHLLSIRSFPSSCIISLSSSTAPDS